MSQDRQINQADARVNILSLIIRLGHESFKRKNMKSKISHILNNTRIVTPYDRACIIDNTTASPKITGVTGEESVNQNSEYATMIRELVFPILKTINKLTEINHEYIKTLPDSEKITSALNKYLSKHPNSSLLLSPLPPPEDSEREGAFIWVTEYFNSAQETERHKLGLLSQSYAESLWYSMAKAPPLYKTIKEETRKKKTLITALICLAAALLLFTLKVDLNVSSDFEISSADSEIKYAPFAGKIEEIYVKNAEIITKGQLLVKYDTQELLYDLSAAHASYNETAAKLDAIRQKSFSDKSALPEVKILELQKEKDRINIQKIKWYLDHSSISSGIAGRVIAGEKKEFEGRAVQTGEKLLEVVSDENLIAKIYLNEKDAAVLKKITSITLYLHSKPEEGIPAQVMSVSPKAEYSENRQFCFIVKASFDNKNRNLIYGMRGTARVGGERVSIGYYLIRNIIIWWRKV